MINKKAQIGEGITLFISLSVLIILCFLFLFIFSAIDTTNDFFRNNKGKEGIENLGKRNFENIDFLTSLLNRNNGELKNDILNWSNNKINCEDLKKKMESSLLDFNTGSLMIVKTNSKQCWFGEFNKYDRNKFPQYSSPFYIYDWTNSELIQINFNIGVFR